MKRLNTISKFSSKYFIDTMKILDKKNNVSTLNFFSFNDSYVLSGIEEVKKIIYNSIHKKDLKNIEIYSRKDGDILSKKEPCLIIKGDYSKFAYLENIIDGILSRMSSVATNVKNILKLTDKDIIFMADRSDIYLNQPYDAKAAYLSGIRMFVTKSMVENLPSDAQYVGTIPHSLIQQHEGDIVQTLISYNNFFPNGKLVALIDYNNDCESEIEKIAKSDIKDKVWAVRIDTSSSLIDKGLERKGKKIYGVNSELIKLVRKALDKKNMNDVKIIVSSGINKDSIIKFNKEKALVDIYGIGSAFIERTVFFTGDLIELNEKLEAKFGRKIEINRYIDKMVKW